MLVNIVLVPDMVQLDATGPIEVMARVPGWNIDPVVASLDEPVRTKRGLPPLPTGTRETAPPSDLFVVLRGSGIDRAMLDSDWVAYTRREGKRAKYVLRVCTGAAARGIGYAQRPQGRRTLAFAGAACRTWRRTIGPSYDSRRQVLCLGRSHIGH